MAQRADRRPPSGRPTVPTGPDAAEAEAGAGNLSLRAGRLALNLQPAVFLLAAAGALAGAALLGGGWGAGPAPALPRALAGPVLIAPVPLALFAVLAIATPVGGIRLGGVAARPEFGRAAWLAMLAAAGIGAQLVVLGVAEPVAHLAAALAGPLHEGGGRVDPGPLGGAPGDPRGARPLALAAAMHHWGPLPWALPATLGLALALASYNRGLPLSPRAVLHPLIGARAWGWPGHLLDAAAAGLTAMAMAVALALGAGQLAAALGYLAGLPAGRGTALVLVGLAAALAGLAAWRGIGRGVRPLALAAAGLSGLLLAFMLLAAPLAAVPGGAIETLAAYGARLFALALPFGRDDAGFQLGWTLPRWAWWLAWTPFLGLFLARISRGRTVREFLASVLLAPPLAAALWLGAFGGTAIDQIVRGGIAAVAEAPPALQPFLVLQDLPLSALGELATLLLMVLLLASSAAPAALSADTMATGGLVAAPPVQRLFWAVLPALAAALVLRGPPGAGTAAALAAAPVLVLFVALACWLAVRILLTEPRL